MLGQLSDLILHALPQSKYVQLFRNLVTLITTNTVAVETSREVMNPMGGENGFLLGFYWDEKK